MDLGEHGGSIRGPNLTGETADPPDGLTHLATLTFIESVS